MCPTTINLYFDEANGNIQIIETYTSDYMNYKSKILGDVRKERLKSIYEAILKYEQGKQS